MARPLHISPLEIERQSHQILQPVKYGESGVGVCYPACKIDYNLSAFLANRSILRKNLGKYYQRFQFFTVVLESTDSFERFVDKVRDTTIEQKVRVSRQATLE